MVGLWIDNKSHEIFQADFNEKSDIWQKKKKKKETKWQKSDIISQADLNEN